MINRKILFAVLQIFVIAATVTAQPQYSMAGKLHPCTGDSVQIMEVTERAAGGEKITLTVLGMSREWTDINAYTVERADYIQGVIEMAALQCSGAGSAMSMPAQAATATFKQAIFTQQAQPRMSKTTAAVQGVLPQKQAADAVQPPSEETKEEGKAVELKVATKEAGPRLMLPPNQVTADLEWDLFSHRGSTGNNFALRAGFARTLPNEKIKVGGTLIINTMLMLQKLFFNNALSLYGTGLLSESSSLERKIGGSINMFLVDKAFAGRPVGVSGGINFSDNWFIRSDNILTYGAMVQQSFLADLSTTLVTVGVQYGLPIDQRFALNAHLVYAINVLTMNDGRVVSVDNPQMLQPALNCSIYLSKLFSFDVGLKKTFLIRDYNDLIVTVGGSILF